MKDRTDIPLTDEQRHIRDWLLRELKAPGKSKSGLAHHCGVSAQAVTKWVREGKITKENLRKAAAYFGSSLGEAYGYESPVASEHTPEFVTIGEHGGPVAEDDPNFAYVPSYRIGASAGPGNHVYTETPNGIRAYSRDWLLKEGLNAKYLVMIEVDGDSMWPTILDGDDILVDMSQREIISGEVYVFRVDNELRVKRLKKNLDGTVTVTSDNKADPSFQEETFTMADLQQMNIIGTVVHRAGKVGRRSGSRLPL